jgi:F420H(2)-dependent quinone reductase
MTETPDAIDDMIKKGPKTLNAFNKNVVDEFRANDGNVGGQFANANLLLLTTTGAKSG